MEHNSYEFVNGMSSSQKPQRSSTWIKLGILIGILILIYLFVISPTVISGSSMSPTINNGDSVLNNKIEYYLSTPIRNDIVIFKSPQNENIDSVGRVIATGGDTVQIKEGEVHLNGNVLREPYTVGITLIPTGEKAINEDETFTVPKDSLFILTDNRQHGTDSRNFGPVKTNKIIGKVVFRIWPSEKAGFIGIVPEKDKVAFTSGEDMYKAGYYFLDRNNETKAQELFAKAGNDYRYAWAFVALGNLKYEKHEYEAARTLYMSALSIESNNYAALRNVGEMYWLTGNRPEAIKYYKEAYKAYQTTDMTEERSQFETFLKNNKIIE